MNSPTGYVARFENLPIMLPVIGYDHHGLALIIDEEGSVVNVATYARLYGPVRVSPITGKE